MPSTFPLQKDNLPTTYTASATVDPSTLPNALNLIDSAINAIEAMLQNQQATGLANFLPGVTSLAFFGADITGAAASDAAVVAAFASSTAGLLVVTPGTYKLNNPHAVPSGWGLWVLNGVTFTGAGSLGGVGSVGELDSRNGNLGVYGSFHLGGALFADVLPVGLPTISGLGTHVTSVTPLTGSNNVRGILRVVSDGNAIAANTDLCTVTFATPSPYATAPVVHLQNLSGGAVDATHYPASFHAAGYTAALFHLILGNVATNAGAFTGDVGYVVMGMT